MYHRHNHIGNYNRIYYQCEFKLVLIQFSVVIIIIRCTLKMINQLYT